LRNYQTLEPQEKESGDRTTVYLYFFSIRIHREPEHQDDVIQNAPDDRILITGDKVVSQFIPGQIKIIPY
jgi:hypothetical protein